MIFFKVIDCNAVCFHGGSGVGWCCIWRLVFDLAVWVQLAAWVQLDRRNRVVVNLACGRDQQPRSAPPGDHRGISRGISW